MLDPSDCVRICPKVHEVLDLGLSRSTVRLGTKDANCEGVVTVTVTVSVAEAAARAVRAAAGTSVCSAAMGTPRHGIGVAKPEIVPAVAVTLTGTKM